LIPATPPVPAPLVVGIVTCTPDSFYDGGRHDTAQRAVAHGRRLISEGADWLDIGGESTRPNAPAVSVDEECGRVLDVIMALAGAAPVSIDTTKPTVARRAADAGATILNDVRGLSDPGMAEVSALFEATIVMHSRGTPRTMRSLTDYGDLITEVCGGLLESAARARSPQVWIDPGIGFAKTAAQSLALLRHTRALVSTGYPVLIGASRKSFIGHTLDLPDAGDRLPGSLAAVAATYARGARAFRVHDVAATRQLLDLLCAIDDRGE